MGLGADDFLIPVGAYWTTSCTSNSLIESVNRIKRFFECYITLCYILLNILNILNYLSTFFSEQCCPSNRSSYIARVLYFYFLPILCYQVAAAEETPHMYESIQFNKYLLVKTLG